MSSSYVIFNGLVEAVKTKRQRCEELLSEMLSMAFPTAPCGVQTGIAKRRLSLIPFFHDTEFTVEQKGGPGCTGTTQALV